VKLTTRLLRNVILLLGLFLLSGCLDQLAPYGASLKKMYPDQITIDVVIPANAPSIFQHYRRFPKSVSEQREEHLGIDIVATEGTPVIAPADGRVITSLIEPIYGNTVEIDHGLDAQGRRLKGIYKHMQFRSVDVGDKVRRGQKLGGVGRTGLLSSGVLHLHFELRRENANGRFIAVDPSQFWAKGVGKITCYRNSKRWPRKPFRLTYPVVCR
jgi:murein DD-endopeptidase MepM/ murein hydrolase activator NlpD